MNLLLAIMLDTVQVNVISFKVVSIEPNVSDSPARHVATWFWALSLESLLPSSEQLLKNWSVFTAILILRKVTYAARCGANMEGVAHFQYFVRLNKKTTSNHSLFFYQPMYFHCCAACIKEECMKTIFLVVHFI